MPPRPVQLQEEVKDVHAAFTLYPSMTNDYEALKQMHVHWQQMAVYSKLDFRKEIADTTEKLNKKFGMYMPLMPSLMYDWDGPWLVRMVQPLAGDLILTCIKGG